MSRYESFFTRELNQKGGASSDLGHVFTSPIRFQRGKGLGDVFSKVIKFVAPYLLEFGKSLGSEFTTSASEIASNIGKKPIGELLSDEKNRALKSLAMKGSERMREFAQRGSGKRYLLNGVNTSEKMPLLRKPLKRIKAKRKKVKRTVKKRKPSKKKKKSKKKRVKKTKSKKNILKKLFSAAGVD
jgi:hypothetical protein